MQAKFLNTLLTDTGLIIVVNPTRFFAYHQNFISGKRAIRLDAWAKDKDNRQFNMEMQNSSKQDNIPKRSRFYQGMLDTPILKSGKETKYRELPSTIIIFITQEDIFKKDLAKYTFTEQCEEIAGLHLEDGTTKIFLNMSSKNGSKELVSLLQYMKETTLENPEILIKDKRIVELDRIVSEVKESEKWEAVHMNFMEFCMEKGMEKGIEEGKSRINRLYQKLKADGRTDDVLKAIDDIEYQAKLLKEYDL